MNRIDNKLYISITAPIRKTTRTRTMELIKNVSTIL